VAGSVSRVRLLMRELKLFACFRVGLAIARLCKNKAKSQLEGLRDVLFRSTMAKCTGNYMQIRGLQQPGRFKVGMPVVQAWAVVCHSRLALLMNCCNCQLQLIVNPAGRLT